MAHRNQGQRANERRRKLETYESKSELGSDDESELSRQESYPPMDTLKNLSNPLVDEEQVQQLQNMHNQIEIKVESSISNSRNAQHPIVHQRKGKVNSQRLVRYLFQVARSGEWKVDEAGLSLDRNIARIEITERGDTALHIAVAAKQTAFVHNLVELLSTSDLELKNKHGNTAFCLAAVSGVVEIAKVMYYKNKNLPTIRSSMGKTPLEMAILCRNIKMAEYLYPITHLADLNDEEYFEILVSAIHADIFGIAIKMFNEGKTRIIASPTTNIGNILKALASKPLSHNHGSQGRIWERLVSIIATIPYIPCFKEICGSIQMRRQARQLVEQILTLEDLDISKLIEETQTLTNAAEIGNVEFLTLFGHLYPDILWNMESNNYSIFHVAVTYRREKVFRLIYGKRAYEELMMLYRDDNGNNILHLAGKLAPPSRLNNVFGATFQMQRELQWFKEVEKIVPYSLLDMKNNSNKTPRKLFLEEHKKLMEDAAKCVKDDANYCTVVATLIATVTFAAAFTVPGGSNGTGTPVFLKNQRFTSFVLCDALAMFSSITSIIMFLSIITSQNKKDDFLISSLERLTVGLVAILASFVWVVLAFTANFFLIYNEEKHGLMPGIVAALAIIPVTVVAAMYYGRSIPLLYLSGWRLGPC